MSDECIFCHHDPYHYVDIGVGFQAAAVTCCELGVALYQYGDEDVTKVADRIEELEAKLKMAIEALEFYADADNYEDQHKRESCGCCHYLQDAEIKQDEGVKARVTLAELKGEQP